MKTFQFKLEKILDLRKYKEKETEIDLGRAMGALYLIENRIRTNAENYAKNFDARFDSGRDIRDMQFYDRYLERLEIEKERLLREAAEAQIVVDEKREAYLAASRERKTLDKLKEKRQADYRKAVFAEETKTIDDVVSSRTNITTYK